MGRFVTNDYKFNSTLPHYVYLTLSVDINVFEISHRELLIESVSHELQHVYYAIKHTS